MVLSPWQKSLRRFTRFTWWMQTACLVAANPQTKPTNLGCDCESVEDWQLPSTSTIAMSLCLQRGADCLHMVQLMPLHPKTPSMPTTLASFKSRQILPFWYWLTQAVLVKRPLKNLIGVVAAVVFLSSLCVLKRCTFLQKHANKKFL